MGKQAIIGEVFVVQAMFWDDTNTPFDPTVGPTIDIFSFSTAGAKNTLVDGEDMDAVTPAETGRFVYPYTIPSTLEDGTMLYVEINGEDALGAALVETQEILVIAATRSGIYNNAGLTASFSD